MTYWHYTCDHAQSQIGDHGTLLPLGKQRPGLWLIDHTKTDALLYSLVWLTDLPEPDITGLGLTSQTLSCERWRHRYRVADDRPVIAFPHMQHMFTPQAQMDLLHHGARPEHWYVSFRPIPVIYNPIEEP